MKDKSHLILQKYRAKEARRILKNVPTLDLGGGDGWLVSQAVNPDKITCVDLNREALSKNPCAKKIYGDISKLKIKKNTFSQITLFEVLEHIPTREQRVQILSEAYRVLKFGGKLFISTPSYERLSTQLRNLIGKKRKYPYPVYNMKGTYYTDWHYLEYSEKSLKEDLKKAGFRKIKVYCKFVQIPFLKNVFDVKSKFGVVLYSIAKK